MAADEFAANGFRSTSLQSVAKRAQITKGAIYHHFSNKENLAASVVEEHYALWPALVSDVGAAGLPPFETVVHLLDRVVLTFRDDPIVQASARLQIERTTIGIPLPTPFVGWTQLLTDLLRGAEEAGQLRAGCTPEVAARVIVAAFFGIQHISDALHNRTDIVERWQEVKDTLLPAIRAL
ncbi:TetR/AcrR family transcriptional regulator [Peterkaempfera bronchialis]|uniref:TetR/AcrR family transcriptional regulator n=1 Tax=Peterkaempfera bronchialis TaxID=2126346 RepID=A0A345SU55_9ACTN|nr:TetR/AcrR family transcriptional regulator [Peterkaempfera bronchialis]